MLSCSICKRGGFLTQRGVNQHHNAYHSDKARFWQWIRQQARQAVKWRTWV